METVIIIKEWRKITKYKDISLRYNYVSLRYNYGCSQINNTQSKKKKVFSKLTILHESKTKNLQMYSPFGHPF